MTVLEATIFPIGMSDGSLHVMTVSPVRAAALPPNFTVALPSWTVPLFAGGFWKAVLFTPLYWLMQSRAGWRALGQIVRDPHRWEKTPHRRHADGKVPVVRPPLSFREEPVLLR